MGMRVKGFRLGAKGLGFRVQALRFRVWVSGLGFKIERWGCKDHDGLLLDGKPTAPSAVWGLGITIEGLRLRVEA